MTSNKPYLIRALYEWIVDNGLTPYLVLAADYPTVQVPSDFVNDGQITLNVAPTAVRDLLLENDSVAFSARFGGVSYDIFAPTGAVIAIFAKENGQGMGFEIEPMPEEIEAEVEESIEKPAKKKPSLKVVK